MADPIQTYPNEPSREEDERLEMAIGLLLRIGVTTAAALVLIGGVMALRHPGMPVPSYRTFHGPDSPVSAGPEGPALHSISGVFQNLTSGTGPSIIALGLLTLIFTPIARVLFAIIGFARERDWLYTVISFIVLAILAFSLVHGI